MANTDFSSVMRLKPHSVNICPRNIWEIFILPTPFNSEFRLGRVGNVLHFARFKMNGNKYIQKNHHHQFIIFYFEKVAFFHAKPRLDVCPRVDHQTSGYSHTLQNLTRPLIAISQLSTHGYWSKFWWRDVLQHQPVEEVHPATNIQMNILSYNISDCDFSIKLLSEIWYILAHMQKQRRSEGFWHPGRRLPFGVPSPAPQPNLPTPPKKKLLIHQNLRNRLNYSKNLAIKNKLNFCWAIFSSEGPSGLNISIFLEDRICFLSMWGRQNVN